MANIKLVDASLFGDVEGAPETAGEAYFGGVLLANWEEGCERANWCLSHLPPYGSLLLDLEDGFLLRDALNGYIFGLFAATIISADAFIERIVTDTVESHGVATQKFGFGRTLDEFRKLRIIDNYLVERIARTHKIRNNFAHEKGPDHSFRIFRRAMSRRILESDLIREDAKEALCIAYSIAGILKRNFPRLDLPGTKLLPRSAFTE